MVDGSCIRRRSGPATRSTTEWTASYSRRVEAANKLLDVAAKQGEAIHTIGLFGFSQSRGAFQHLGQLEIYAAVVVELVPLTWCNYERTFSSASLAR